MSCRHGTLPHVKNGTNNYKQKETKSKHKPESLGRGKDSNDAGRKITAEIAGNAEGYWNILKKLA